MEATSRGILRSACWNAISIGLGLLGLALPGVANGQTDQPLTCAIRASKDTYCFGDTLDIQISITNGLDRRTYLIGCLDGSERRRYPHCMLRITDSLGVEIPVAEPAFCGNQNGLRADDFVPLLPGWSFDPVGGFSPLYALYPGVLTKVITKPGLYRFRFQYSTQSDSLAHYLGDLSPENVTSAIREQFDQVPKVMITSNELALTFRNCP